MSGERRQNAYYVLADVLSTNVAVLLFNIFRYYDMESVQRVFYTLGDFLSSPMLILGQIVFPLFMMLVYYLSGFYSTSESRSRTSEFSVTLTTALIGTLAMIFAALINDLTTDRRHDYLLFLMLLLLLFAVVYIPRLLITLHGYSKLRSGVIHYNTLVVGYGSHPESFAGSHGVATRPGMRTVAYIDADNRTASSSDALGDMAVYRLDDIEDVCRRLCVERIVVIPHPDGWVPTLGVLNKLFALGCPVYMAAESLPPYVFHTRISSLMDEPYIDISRTHMSAATLNIKRAFDVVLSSAMIILACVPVSLLCVAIMLDSKGSPFYLQERVGRGKRRFRIIKLRSMCAGSEAAGKPELSRPGDPRITRIGRILRRYHIDELPQFVNVLKGDMSIVGPRPERPHYVDLIVRENPSYTLVHRVRPGITSLGMVKFGYASTVHDMVRRMNYDLIYLQELSLVTDIKIILRTISNVCSGKGV